MANKFSAVLTAKQERQAGVSSANIWYTSGNSGKDLWKLKANNPELFAKQAAGADAVPSGFEETERPGWFYNRAEKIFWLQSTKQLLWFDEEAGEHKELGEGESFQLAFGGGAASSSEVASAKTQLKTVVIPDLHRVASALKADLSHIDKPAAMLGVFGGGEMAARAFPERLVKRLAAYRSSWSKQKLRSAVELVLRDMNCDTSVSVVVVAGCRATAVCGDGAAFRITVRPVQGSTLQPPSLSASSLEGVNSCLSLTDGHALFAACSAGATDKSGLLEEPDFERILAPQLLKGWARTGSISLLRSARESGITGPLAVVCARLMPTELPSNETPAKRLKMGSSSPIFSLGTSGAVHGGKADQVRLRQILLRVAASGPPVMDPVRRKQVKRSQEEAEAEMLKVLQNLEMDGMKSFQRVCREISECQSALKGGELAGDMGWLDRVKGVGIQQDRAKQGVRPQVPAAVLKAAFEMAVGEVHDLVSTEVGVHLLQRTA